MQKLEDTVVIMFPGGTYGKYLFWILNNFTPLGLQTDINFTPSFSSHNQTINGEPDPDFTITDHWRWDNYIKSNKYLPFYVRHLVDGSTDNLHEPIPELNNVARTVKKVMLIQSNKHLQALDNVMDKTFPNKQLLFDRLNRFEDFKIDTSKLSEVREMLSYKLFFLTYRDPVEHNHLNVLNVNLDDLLFNFKNTIDKILDFLDTKLTIGIDVLLEYHNNMLSSQEHLHKDKYIERFLYCFENDIPCSLPKNCTIIDEAYIQHYLRDQLNLELRCDGLEVFPNTASKLKDLTYPAEEMVRE